MNKIGQQENAVFSSRGLASGLVVTTLCALALTAGCRSKSDADGAAGASGSPPPAASKAKAIQDVQNNQNIPPEAKANIMRQMQGGRPPSAPK